MEFQGIIIYKSPIETVGQNGTEKITVVIEEVTDREYKSSIVLENLGERVNLLRDIPSGTVVKVYLNPRAREYNGRRYGSLSAWKVEQVGTESSSGNANTAAPASKNEDIDLPF